MKIFVSAAEISSDIHAEKILRSIQKRLSSQGVSVDWMGIGGPKVCSLPGFRAIESAENLRTMGFIEVLKKYSFFKKLISRTAEEIERFNPDLILTFDYPDFHFRLLDLVVGWNLAPNALRVCGIPPKVWVWRSYRVEKIRHYYHGVWVIFPFEKTFYETRGIPVIYEGNPLLDELLSDPSITEIQKKPLETITVMPGSRDAELKCHLPVIASGLEMFAQKAGKKITAQVPLPEGSDDSLVRSVLKKSDKVEYVFLKNSSARSLKETRIGLIKSGTSTLEAVILDCIPVIFYKMNWISEQIYRWFIRGWGGYLGPVGLPNILLNVKKRKDSFFPEFLGPEATAESLSEALFQLYSTEKKRSELLAECEKVRKLFFQNGVGRSSAELSSEKILQWKIKPPVVKNDSHLEKSFIIGFISFVWSCLNWIRRRLTHAGILHSKIVQTPSILVGNLQAGGAGKTPIVIALASAAVARGKKVAVISRGYGSSTNESMGDEPREIQAAVPQALVLVNPDRLRAVEEAEKNKVDLILFDDGFQNLKFKAKINLIAVTGRDRSEVVYRDFDSEIKFADFVIGTKGSSFRDAFIRDRNKFFRIEWKWQQQISQPVWLLCGIADPKELIHFYQTQGLEIKKTIIKADHATLDTEEVKNLIMMAKKEGCSLAMTEKDIVKVPTLSSEILILRRSILNQDWIDAIFKSTL